MDSLLKIDRLKLKSLPNLKELSLQVNKGEIIGVFGKVDNGQEKIIDAICGLKKFKSGKIELVENFYAINHDSSIYEDLTVLENLKFTSEVYGTKPDLNNLLETTGLKKYINTVIKDLPLALKKMAQIACVLSTDFELLIIEEPSMGLDDASNIRIIDIARKLTMEDKGIIIFTSRSNDLNYCTKVLNLETEEMED